ncbi:M1 family peptidase [Pseudonocardiaceae bacterium YIM PH 21723]|nr:M1 family peptidase [Pseudonocardiaceae bacterium YIM PH 21723]
MVMRRITAAMIAGLMLTATPQAMATPDPVDDGINVGHYSVDLNYRPSTDVLSGVTTILSTATRDLAQFDLKFLLKVSSVSVNNEPATYSVKDGKLSITPKKPLANGADMIVVVRYSDTPGARDDGLGFGWLRTPTGAVAVGSPAYWYPSAVDQADQATLDLSAVVPTGVEVITNGVLKFDGPLPAPGGDKWQWRNDRPGPSNASLLAIGQYDLKISKAPNGQQVVNAYSADLGALDSPARAAIERTPEIVNMLSHWFGPYPYNAQGGLVDSKFFNVVATTSRPIYKSGVFETDWNSSVVAHENAHQWYGNVVNPLGNGTRWLGEAFATYAEFLWSQQEGLGTAAELAQYYYDKFPADHPDWKAPPTNPDPTSSSAFPIYTRGAIALQALRTEVGDETFFRILRNWAAEQKPDTAPTTEEFTALAERVSGKDLKELFHAWLYAPERPAVGPNGPTTARSTVKPLSYDTVTANAQRFAAAKHHM